MDFPASDRHDNRLCEFDIDKDCASFWADMLYCSRRPAGLETDLGGADPRLQPALDGATDIDVDLGAFAAA